MKLRTFLLMSVLVSLSNPALALESLNIDHANIFLESNQTTTIEAQNFSLDYAPLSINHPSPLINLSLAEEMIEATLGDLTLQYKPNQSGMISSLKGVESENLKVQYDQGRNLTLSTDYLYINFGEQQTQIPQFDLSCMEDQLKVIENPLDICLQLGRLSIPELNFDQLTMNKIREKFTLDPLTNKVMTKGLDKIEEINLQIFRGSLSMSFKAKFLFKWKVKVQGYTSWDGDKEQLRIRVDSAKVGFLSIKKTLFKQLREANISSLSIVGNTIVFQL